MQQEEDDDDTDDDHLFGQGVAKGVDRPENQFRPVVGCDDLDTRGECRFDFSEALLDARDHVNRVFSVAHHHDTAHCFTAAIQFGHTAAHVWTKLYCAQVPYEDRCARRTHSDRDQFQVLCRSHIAPAPHHVLGRRNF